MSAIDPDEGFEPVPATSEPPEGDRELALQEEAVGTAGVAPAAPPPPVVGRSWRIDFENGRIGPPIRGEAARRQAIEKALRTERGAADVHDDEYGMEGAADEGVDGSPFDAAKFAELEERVRDALLALPWVLDVIDFEAEGSLVSTRADVTFRVIPDGDLDPIDFDRYPLPIP